MSDKFKNSKFYKTMKNPKVSRAIYVSVALMLIAVAVVVGITAAANRSKKAPTADEPQGERPSTNAPQVSDVPSTDVSDGSEEKPEESQAPANKEPTSPSSGKLPDFSLPVSGKITEYHDPKLQVFSETMNDYRVHVGIDISAEENSPVYAAAEGTVTKIWKDPMMGYSIAVSHSGESVTVYKNLANVLPEGIEEGARVKAGQQIASVGESALTEIAEEPHLHFEMTVGGILVDPLEYYSETELESLAADKAYEG